MPYCDALPKKRPDDKRCSEQFGQIRLLKYFFTVLFSYFCFCYIAKVEYSNRNNGKLSHCSAYSIWAQCKAIMGKHLYITFTPSDIKDERALCNGKTLNLMASDDWLKEMWLVATPGNSLANYHRIWPSDGFWPPDTPLSLILFLHPSSSSHPLLFSLFLFCLCFFRLTFISF